MVFIQSSKNRKTDKQYFMTLIMKGLVLFCILNFSIVSFSFSQEKINFVHPFKKGEKIAFIGNSITHGGFYHSLIYLFYQTRYPNQKIKIYNCGISGGQLSGALRRLNDDVLRKTPHYTPVMFGMNDVGYANLYKEGLEVTPEIKKQRQKLIDKYTKNLDTISERLHANNIKIIYFTPTIYDETVKLEKGVNNIDKNKALYKCKKIVEETANRYNSPVVDFYTILDSLNKIMQKKDPTATIIGADRVHPGINGHLVMAYTFLMAQKHSKYVSETVLDAKQLKILKSTNCTVNNLKKIQDGIQFTNRENALPFPLKPDRIVLQYIPFIKNLNQEILQIKNLPDGNYLLKIDAEKIDTCTHSELEDGINLAMYENTPQYTQANNIKSLNEWRRRIEAERIRSLALYDYGWLYEHQDKTIEQKARIFNDKLNPLKEKSFYGYLREQADNYLIFKGEEDNTKKLLLQIEQSIYSLNKPLIHKYTIRIVE